MKKIAILGSTGSIGTQTLEVVENNGDIQVEALSANGNVDLLEKQARKFKPSVIAVFREDAAMELKERLKDMNIRIVTGMDGLIEIATLPETDILVTAIVGMIGILPTIEAIKAGKDIALANKETLVTAGHIIMPLAERMGTAPFSRPFTGKTGAELRRFSSQPPAVPSGEKPGRNLRMFRWRTP